jgi:acyl-coenzyme A synthetase/AMP-(fatty) acid ligase
MLATLCAARYREIMSHETFNLAEYVLREGALVPGQTALSVVSPETTDVWTFARLIGAIRGTATGLLDRGLKPGDIVLMRLSNTPDFPLAYLGALAAGLVPVPTAAALTAPEVGKIIATLKPVAVLHDPDVSCPDDVAVIDLNSLRAMRDLPPADWHMGDSNRLGYIIYTSGTSGTPSAVMHAHRAILARRMMFDGWYDLRGTDRVMHAGAFNWTYTLGTGLMDPWTMGAAAVIPAPGTVAADLLTLMARHKATIFAAAPGVYRQILKNTGRFELPQLRHGLSAGEKLSTVVHAAWTKATGTTIYEAFGMSECSTFISGSPAKPAKDGALGFPQPGRNVQILTDQGAAQAGETGTIAIHRSDPGLMLGYFNAPDETAERYQGDWFLTGDQGMMDAHGQITYLGRNDDMMNAGGFRVSPLEVEAVMAGMTGIDTIGVTEVEIKEGVRVIAGFYTGPCLLDDTILEAYASEKLARYKQPRLYVHLPALPAGANGKILRRALRADYEAIK